MFRYLDSNEPPFYGNNLLYNASAFAVASTLNDKDKKKHHNNSNPVYNSSNSINPLQQENDFFYEENEDFLEDEDDFHEQLDVDGLHLSQHLNTDVTGDLEILENQNDRLRSLLNSVDSDSEDSQILGGSPMLQKYIKYKTKYINLKNKINLKL